MTKTVGVKVQQAVIWLSIVAVVWFLRHLFPVLFLTFVLTYIGHTILDLMGRRLPHRRLNLTILYAVFLLALLGMSAVIVPRLGGEARTLAQSYISQQAHEANVDPEALPATTEDSAVADVSEKEILLDRALLPLIGPASLAQLKQSPLYVTMLEKMEEGIESLVPLVVNGVKLFLNNLFLLAFHFTLSIIFSFIILWDLPKLGASLRTFSEGRTAEVYAEVAPGIRTFCVILGRAFEAQTGIAIVNSGLTAIGFWAIGLESIALLSTIVFFCSYIPVLGVVLSTLPAAILAFKAGGIVKILLLVAIILIVHAVEAYGLNPLIYGHHLHMHPIAVLVILMVGEHLFGVWGLLLGVPVSAFILKYVVKGEVAS